MFLSSRLPPQLLVIDDSSCPSRQFVVGSTLPIAIVVISMNLQVNQLTQTISHAPGGSYVLSGRDSSSEKLSSADHRGDKLFRCAKVTSELSQSVTRRCPSSIQLSFVSRKNCFSLCMRVSTLDIDFSTLSTLRITKRSVSSENTETYVTMFVFNYN